MSPLPPVRVLVPYWLAAGGGVYSVLLNGLPLLARDPALSVVYAELGANAAEMQRFVSLGVPVLPDVGVPGSWIVAAGRGARRLLNGLKSGPRLARIASRIRSASGSQDVLYVHGYRDLLLATAAVRSINPRRRPAIVWHCHGLDDTHPPLLLRNLASRCTAIIAISRDVKHRMLELGIPRDKITVVLNAVPDGGAWSTSLVSPLPARVPGERIVLLPCSSIRRNKGVDLAVRALASLDSSIRLWITGDTADHVCFDYLAELRQLADTLGVSGRVDFIGQRSDIRAVMTASDVVLVPSTCREGFGLVAAEAMVQGRPVVVSARGALPEVLGSRRCGWIFEPSCAGSLEECVREVIADDGEARRRAVAGAERAKSLFRYERWAIEVRDVLIQARMR